MFSKLDVGILVVVEEYPLPKLIAKVSTLMVLRK